MPARTSARRRPDPATLNTDERFRSRRDVLRRPPESALFKLPAAQIGVIMPDPIRVDPDATTTAAPAGRDSAAPPSGSAEDVNRWWNSLDQGDRDRLIREHPPELGNLNGIPAEVRHKINRAVLSDDLTRVEDIASHHGVPVDAVTGNPALYGLSSADMVRYRNAIQTKQGLDHHRGSDPGNPRPVLLWAYDPLAFNGQGRAAIAIDNPDEAENIAVVVPGAGSSVAGGWLRGDGSTGRCRLGGERGRGHRLLRAARPPRDRHRAQRRDGRAAPAGAGPGSPRLAEPLPLATAASTRRWRC